MNILYLETVNLPIIVSTKKQECMNSSRMRTVRCNTHLGGGGCLPGRGVSAWQGWCLPGRGGVCLAEGVSAWQRGVCLAEGWCKPPLPRGQKDTCENITFPRVLLRTVKNKFHILSVKTCIYCRVAQCTERQEAADK